MKSLYQINHKVGEFNQDTISLRAANVISHFFKKWIHQLSNNGLVQRVYHPKKELSAIKLFRRLLSRWWPSSQDLEDFSEKRKARRGRAVAMLYILASVNNQQSAVAAAMAAPTMANTIDGNGNTPGYPGPSPFGLTSRETACEDRRIAL
ncbi:hypothetical protein V1477_006583 [Vespula maculifrons]|uniref:Uncharacterized protein n=1 Tax=Vespula maculifrons TaxID=7453 RepID=A0ABD2CJ90_VESMC